MSYDLVVAGGGFSGIACAKAAAEAGLQTLVLERKPWPGTRVHTTGIIVKELAEEWNIPISVCKKIESVRLYSPSFNKLDLTSPHYYFLATDTPALLKWHIKQAIDTGVTIQFESSYRQSKLINHYHHINEGDIKARYLVGCDGAHSRVARNEGLGINKNFLYGLEAEFAAGNRQIDNCLHVFLDSDIARGYAGWLVPGVNSIQVGLATRYPNKPGLDRFIRKIAPLYDFTGCKPFEIRAGLIPCGGPVKPFYSNESMLLGDAAGMVSPLTAGGIHTAIQSGFYTGELLADYLLHGGNNPGITLSHSLPGYFFKRLARILYDLYPVSNRGLDSIINNISFRLLAQTIFFHHRGLLAREAWQDFFKLIYNEYI